MDKVLRQEISIEVRRALEEGLMLLDEHWLNDDQLIAQFNFFTKSWLKRYGHLLPRTQVIVEDDAGSHRTSWCYPRNKIQRMILNGDITKLKYEKNKIRQ